MSDIVVDDHLTEDWIGFLLLAVAPTSLMARVTDAVSDVERAIYGDPVLVDMARVGVPETPAPLDGDLDAVASGLHRDLVAWARSTARNPAPRFTFCVLVVHDDAEEAERLVHSLVATSVLSDLPIIFRIGNVTTTPDDDIEPGTDIARMIHEAIDATAHEVDRTPDILPDERPTAARRTSPQSPCRARSRSCTDRLAHTPTDRAVTRTHSATASSSTVGSTTAGSGALTRARVLGATRT